ncbi:MAG: hypothetical protein ACK5LS_01230 [Propioniciclava sp.]
MKPFLTWLVYAAILIVGTLIITVVLTLVAVQTQALVLAIIIRGILNLALLILASRMLRAAFTSAPTLKLWLGSLVVLLLNLNLWSASLLWGQLTANWWLANGIDFAIWLAISAVALRPRTPLPTSS